MYVQRNCRENCTGQLREEITNHFFTENYNGNREVLEAMDAVTGLGIYISRTVHCAVYITIIILANDRLPLAGKLKTTPERFVNARVRIS
jgi:hypothetical protein